MKIKVLLLTLVFISGFFFLSASGKAEVEEKGSLKVVASTSIVADVVRQVAGDVFNVKGLIKPGQDPHGYEPTPRDMAAVEKADILFLNGFGLEEGLIRTLENVSTGLVVEVSEPLEGDEHDHEADEHHDDEDEHDHEADEHYDNEDEHHHEEEDHHHHHGGEDPHTWMSPLNVVEWTEYIAEVLSENDRDNEDLYHRNAEAYIEKLLTVHKEIQELVGTVPEEKRVLITDHDAFGYYADLYGFKVAGTILPNLSTNSETSAKHLSELVELLKAENIQTLFIGATAGSDIRKLTEALGNELGRPVKIQTLLTGALTEEGGDAQTYLDFLRYNTSQIVEGLK